MTALRQALGLGVKSASSRFISYADAVEMYGSPSASGFRVTATSALQVTTVLACVRAIANGVGQVPLHVYRRTPDGRGKEKVPDDPVYRMLNRRPNREQTSIEFRQTLTMHAALTGSGFGLIMPPGRAGGGEILPLLPNWVTVRTNGDSWDPEYTVTIDGRPLGVFDSRRILHIRNPSWDAVEGLSALALARNAIGLAIATEDHHSRLHANGGRPGGILTTDQPIDQPAKDLLAKDWRSAFSGANSFKTAILDRGMQFHPVATTGIDAQHLETRRFQVEEICRAFDVYPQIVMHGDKTATFASAEAFFSAHVRQTLGPWFTLWEQRLDEFVLDGAGPLFCEFDRRELTRAPLKDRQAAYRTFAEMGIYTRNEIREMEGLPPLPGLDEPLTPLNMNGDDQGGAAAENDVDDEDSDDAETNG